MKEPRDRTKVVLRHLPPTLSESMLMEQLDSRFVGRYNWVSFRPGRITQKNQKYSRAYIDFKKPEDVIEFADFFSGHLFVNEKGFQFKTIVEYAPSQRAPKNLGKKDGREGTIFRDPEYLEFLELLAKPVENLPSAEIQLERREAEHSGASKELPIVTPLMDFVRQKRAAKSGSQRSSANGKLSRRGATASISSVMAARRESKKKRGSSTSVYVLRDNTKNTSSKEKSTYILLPRGEEQQPLDNSISVVSGAETLEDQNGKKKILLLKGKEKEISQVSMSGTHGPNVTSPSRTSSGSTVLKQNHRNEASGRVTKSILLNKEIRLNQTSISNVQSDQISASYSEKDKRSSRATASMPSVSKELTSNDSDIKKIVNDKVGEYVHGFSEKQERRVRNKDRPDRSIWAPLRRPDGLNGVSESSSMENMSISKKVGPGISKNGDSISADIIDGSDSYLSASKPRSLDSVHISRTGEPKTCGNRGAIVSSQENGYQRHAGRRGHTHGLKDIESAQNVSEAKSSKRVTTIGYGSHEKQVWVQKSGAGS